MAFVGRNRLYSEKYLWKYAASSIGTSFCFSVLTISVKNLAKFKVLNKPKSPLDVIWFIGSGLFFSHLTDFLFTFLLFWISLCVL